MKITYLILIIGLFTGSAFAQPKQTKLTTEELQKVLGINTWSFDLDEKKSYSVSVGYKEGDKGDKYITCSKVTAKSVKVVVHHTNDQKAKIFILKKPGETSTTFDIGKITSTATDPEPALSNGIYKLIYYKTQNGSNSYIYLKIEENKEDKSKDNK